MASAARKRTLLGVALFLPLAAVLLVTFACLPAPVGDPETAKVNAALVGGWQGTDADGNKVLVLVRPWDKHTYFVQYMMNGKKDGQDDNQVVHLKGWLSSLGNATFMTMESVDRLDFVSAEEGGKGWWLVGKVKVAGNAISFRPVNQDSPLVKDLETREKLEEAIKGNIDNDALYGKELTLEKVGKEGKVTDEERKMLKTAFEMFRIAGM